MKKLVAILAILSLSAFAAQTKQQVVKIKTSAVCKMCKARLERDMSLSKGVEKAELSLDNKVLTIAYNDKKISPAEIRFAVTKIGYDADHLVADQKAHDRLPKCCRKDVQPH